MSFAPGRLEAALRYAAALPDERARQVARDVARRVLELHREGLGRLVAALDAAGEPGRRLLDQVVSDDAVRSLLELHDLLPGSAAPIAPPRPHTACELCAQPVPATHPHLLAMDRRTLTCACNACAILFDGGASDAFRRIRPILVRLKDLRLSDRSWESLGVPVGLAFFTVRSSIGAAVAAYPGPAGAVEAPVDAAAWSAVVAEYPAIADLAPDVEALLVSRLGAEPEAYRVSVDRCFELAGIVRSHWSGVSGGSRVAGTIDAFFASLRREAAA